MIYGAVKGTSNTASFEYFDSFNTHLCSVSRVSQGRYKVTFRKAFASSSRYHVLLQGMGWVDDVNPSKSTAFVKATLLSKEAGYFEVGLSDDASSNDGTFFFMVISM